jgi:hypothetical protein
MKKLLLLPILLLCMIGIANAGTLAALGVPIPEQVTSITAVDNTLIYLVTNKGNIYSQNLSTGAFTKTATIQKKKATAIVTTGTYNYVGTATGEIYTQTISGGAISTTLLCKIGNHAITDMYYDATAAKVYVSTNTGQIYTCTP